VRNALPAIDKSVCVVFVVWGAEYVDLALRASRSEHLREFDKLLITDRETPVDTNDEISLLRVDFELVNNARKAEISRHLPQRWTNFILLDSDTVVLGDLALGVEKALRHGIAMAPANTYLLEQYPRVETVMQREGIQPRGQIQYNAGVVFFSTSYPGVKAVLDLWLQLCKRYSEAKYAWSGDQPYLNLALELSEFSTYCLSRNYNYRPSSIPIQGIVRVWHSTDTVPGNINSEPSKWRRFNSRLGVFENMRSPKSSRHRIMRWFKFLKSKCLGI